MSTSTTSPNMRTYAEPRLARSLLDIATSAVPYVALIALMYALLDRSLTLTLLLAIPAAGFLLRTFIVFHDCGHGSFFSSSRANMWVGRLCALLVWQPYASWRHDHAVHHSSAGDLDRRGTGDVLTLTVSEYYERSLGGRLAYRLFRNPVVMFGIGPIWSLMIGPRLSSRSKRVRLRRSIAFTNLGLGVIVGAQWLLFGWQAFLVVAMLPLLLAAIAGVWMFYVQHQFEDVYWETGANWSYEEAALQGSSYLKLPQPLQFFTGNIGLHHVHHLSAKVPNYNLQRAHDENPVLHEVPVLTVRDALRSVRLKLIDTDSGRLLTWSEAQAIRRARPGAGALSSLRALGSRAH